MRWRTSTCVSIYICKCMKCEMRLYMLFNINDLIAIYGGDTNRLSLFSCLAQRLFHCPSDHDELILYIYNGTEWFMLSSANINCFGHSAWFLFVYVQIICVYMWRNLWIIRLTFGASNDFDLIIAYILTAETIDVQHIKLYDWMIAFYNNHKPNTMFRESHVNIKL